MFQISDYTDNELDAEIAALKNACIPKRFINATLDGYQIKNDQQNRQYQKILRYSSKYSELSVKGTSLILCGKPGTGKTHLACGLIREVITAYCQSAQYKTMFKIFSEIKETYSHNDRPEASVIKKYINLDFLVIDEVGVQYGSDAEKVLFFQVINGRYEEMKPTILISNLNQDELIEYIGEHCFDRMRENSGAVIGFEWESYRV